MKRTLSLLVAVLTFTCVAQAQMSRDEYKTFLTRLNDASIRWKLAISEVNLERIDIPYQQGKIIEDNRAIALKNIEQVQYAARRSRQPNLVVDIALQSGLSDLMDNISEIAHWLPAGELTTAWTERSADLTKEIGRFELDLARHVTARAQYLEDQSRNCRK